VSTAWAFAQWDLLREREDFSRSTLTRSGGKDRKPFVHGQWLENDFEPVIFREYPEIGAIKERLLRYGASVALMSGSGSSVFGLFTSHERAKTAARLLQDAGKVFLQVL
jgi:4-diphosphocytidyl-2-C-methyl-D-erythritol kinase